MWGDSAVEVFDPPRKLVHGWRSLYDPDLAAEDESRVTWEIEEDEHGVCLLTVTHDRLEGAPRTAAGVFGVRVDCCAHVLRGGCGAEPLVERADVVLRGHRAILRRA